MSRTDLEMSELSRFLRSELQQSTYRALEAKTSVSRGALENIINEENQEFPKLETLDKIATAYKLPLWRVINMAGVDLGLTRSVDETVQQLTSLVSRMPEIEPIYRFLLRLYPEDLRGVVAYLESVDRQRNQQNGWSE